MTIHDHVRCAAGELAEAGIGGDRAALDAELLARHVLGWDRARYLAERRGPAPAGFAVRYGDLVTRRRRREPAAYIVGTREFWGLELEVTPDVLIPRPETELIVEQTLAACAGAPPRTIVDVGTGSGCLAVALACEFEHARVTATDVSHSALTVARRNAARHGVASRVGFVQTDLLEGVALEADVIVSNPPYVASLAAPSLLPDVRDHEPAVALYGGPAGLDVIGRLLAQAARCLRPAGLLVWEFGYDHEDDIRALIARGGWQLERIGEDLQGIPRVAVVRRAGTV